VQNGKKTQTPSRRHRTPRTSDRRNRKSRGSPRVSIECSGSRNHQEPPPITWSPRVHKSDQDTGRRLISLEREKQEQGEKQAAGDAQFKR
jgi:hypothetical protein